MTYPEAAYETEGVIVIDPGDYYGLHPDAQALVDALVGVMGLDRDYVTMIAIAQDRIGVWNHDKGADTEYLTELTRRDLEDRPRYVTHELGPMDSGTT